MRLDREYVFLRRRERYCCTGTKIENENSAVSVNDSKTTETYGDKIDVKLMAWNQDKTFTMQPENKRSDLHLTRLYIT